MTKTQRESAERLLLKQMLDTNPKLKQILDGVIDNPNPELNDIVQPLIEQKLKEARMTGINIGFMSHALGCVGKVKKCKDIDEVVKMFEDEAKEIRVKMGLKEEPDEGEEDNV